MSDLLVELRTILFFDDLAAFLSDRFVELHTVALTRRLAALAPDFLIETRAVAIPHRIAALLPASRTDISPSTFPAFGFAAGFFGSAMDQIADLAVRFSFWPPLAPISS